jgi:His-Xaa-Ser system radical SAM maturase HxsC
MIPLNGRLSWIGTPGSTDRSVWLLADRTTTTRQRAKRAFIIDGDAVPPEGFDLYICRSQDPVPTRETRPCVRLPHALDYLAGGDIIAVDARRSQARVMWRSHSPLNSILLTERCNHYCLMCSQPPKERDDSYLLDNARELIRLLPPQTDGLAITGGEPTLYGEQLIDLLRLAGNLLPHAGIHILSNGRLFCAPDFADAYASINNPNMMVGVPIYGPEPTLHDYVVQSAGAFDETVRGIVNLGERRQRIEIRVVIHKQTAPHLPEIAEFIARNLTFVDQVALMGLEMIGFARANIDDLWIDPVDYQPQLVEAVRLLDRRRIRTLVYNHQLCLLDRELWPFAVRSISDWKNEYHPACTTCDVQHLCGGFFFSAKYRHSDHIRPIVRSETELPLLQIA